MKTLKHSWPEGVEELRAAAEPSVVPGQTIPQSPADGSADPRQLAGPLRNKNAMRRRRRRLAQPDGDLSPLPDVEQVPLFIRNVATWRGLGYSLRHISAQSGVTPQALSIMLVRQRASLHAAALGPGELAGLSPRAVSCLGRLGVGTRDKARRLKDLEALLATQRNCGRKTIREILDWTGNCSP